MSLFEIWFSRGIIAVLLIVAWYFVRVWAKRIEEKFDQIIKSLQAMSNMNIEQQEAIKQLNYSRQKHEERLDKHGDRIRSLELVQAKNSK